MVANRPGEAKLTDEFQVTSTEAVNTFHLVLPDDAVPKRASSLHQEHGVSVAAFTRAASA